MERQQLHEKASFSQDKAELHLRTVYRYIVWKHIADTHLGDIGSDYGYFKDVSDQVLSIPYLYISLGGDPEDDFISFKNQLPIVQQILSPAEQDEFLESWLDEIYPKLLFANWGNHCITPDYNVLTKRGWLKYNELIASDEILSYDVGKNKCVWDKINHIIINNIDDNIVEYSTRGFKFSGTTNHRMLGQKAWDRKNGNYKYYLADELSNDIFYIKSSAAFGSSDYPISDNILRLSGWMITDGCIYNSSGGIPDYRIYQSKPHFKIEAILKSMGYSYSIRTRNKKIDIICGKKLIKPPLPQNEIRLLIDSARDFFQYMPTKDIQAWMYLLSDRQFDIFISSVIDGDGSSHGPNSATIYGTNLFLSKLQGLCVMHGYRALLSTNNRGNSVLNITKTDSTIINIKKHKSYSHYSGLVWCLNVPLSNFMVRKNGTAYFTGNSEFEERVSGRNTAKKILAKRTVYFNGIGVCLLYINDICYKIVVTHKTRYNSSFNKTHGLKQLARREIPDADVYLAEHTHDPAYEVSFERGMFQVYAVTGSIKVNDGYAKRYFSYFSTEQDVAFVLDSKKHRIIPFPCLEDALDFAKMGNTLENGKE